MTIRFVEMTQWFNAGEIVSIPQDWEEAYVKRGKAEYVKQVVVNSLPVKPAGITEKPPRDKMMRPGSVVKK